MSDEETEKLIWETNKDCLVDTSFWKERLKEGLTLSIFRGDIPNREHQDIVDKLIPKGASVIDVGCGYGRHSMWFEDYLGVDFSPDMIEKAKNLFPEKRFAVANFFELPAFPNEFDWALSVGCRNMIKKYGGEEKWQLALKEMKRVASKVLILEMSVPRVYEIT